MATLTHDDSAEQRPRRHDIEHGDFSWHHVTSAPILVAVFVALIVLTWITVAATWFDLGNWNLAIAMAIATVKGLLVVLFFMHLIHDKGFNVIIFATALVFVALFVYLTLLDTNQYQGDIREYQYDAAPATATAGGEATSP